MPPRGYKKPTPGKVETIKTFNADLLTDEQRDALRSKAKEHVDKKRIEKAEDEYLQEAIRQHELVDKPDDRLEFITLDLAGHTEFLLIDGVKYSHGETYEVDHRRACTMREMQSRGWDHEAEVGGANRDMYRKAHRKARDLTLNGGMENMSAQMILGIK